MKTAQIGNHAKVHYTVMLEDGEVMGTSKGGMPLSFTIGNGEIIKGLENGVVGMKAGDAKTITIAPEEGYGHRNEDQVIKIRRDELPPEEDIAVGRILQYRNENGHMVSLVVSEADEETVTLDANHPFAGHTLIYKIELVALS